MNHGVTGITVQVYDLFNILIKLFPDALCYFWGLFLNRRNQGFQ